IIVIQHEEQIETRDVLFFEKDGDFIELLHAEEYGMSDEDNPVFLLQMYKGDYDLIFLANSLDIISACFPSGISDGTDRDDIVEKLEMEIAGKWIVYDQDDPDPAYRAMPMWGERNGVTVTNNGADLRGGDKLVPMVRLSARIDVKINQIGYGDKTYKLHSARLYNRRAKARLVPDEANYDFYYASKWDFSIYGPTVPQNNNPKLKDPLYYDIPAEYESAFEGQIYTFETEAKDAVSPDDPLEYTCVVLGIGLETNPGGGATRAYNDGTMYYRVDFIDSTTGEYVPLLRNHNYVITVQSIADLSGFPDPDRAYRSEPYGLTYEVQPWETYYEEIEMGGGLYRLDISQTYFEFILSTEKNIEITATHPDGWSIYTSKYPDRIEKADYLSIVMAYTIDDFQFYLPDTDSEKRGYRLENMTSGVTFGFLFQTFVSPPKGETVTEYLHVVSGNLTNVIAVKITSWITT
ncbi:MAG: hypothetical protein LIO77_04890, partial [Rikenellaceae bacterium]|nr:hypothetical protein [Rikenellaceae bacterium]